MMRAEAVKASVDLRALAEQAGVVLKRQGRALAGLCPFHAEKTPSFYVHAETRPHWFKCFGCGKGGSAIDFVMAFEGCDLKTALDQLRRQAGLSGGSEAEWQARLEAEREFQRAEQARRIAARMASAREIWRSAAHDPDALQGYFAARGIDASLLAAAFPAACPGGVPLSLRFSARCYDEGAERFDPAMVGCVTRGQALLGVHRTFLTRDLRAKRRGVAGAKAKMKGPCDGGAIWLTPPGEEIWIGEGIETVLSVMQEEARRGRASGKSFAAVLSLGNLAGGGIEAFPDPRDLKFMPPPGTRRVVVIEDRDEKDQAAARALTDRAAAKFAGAGLDVRRIAPPQGCDFNDLVRA